MMREEEKSCEEEKMVTVTGYNKERMESCE